jgi:hypothetical protein
MAHVAALFFDLSPLAAEGRKPPDVKLPTIPGNPEILAMFRAWLLKTPRDFSSKLRIPMTVKGKEGELQILLRWLAAGDTAGVALWSNRDHTVAVSILLNGLESIEDLGRAKGILLERGYAIPPKIQGWIDQDERRPLIVSLFYSRGAMRFKELLGVMGLLARAYFDLFGTTED